MSPEAVSNIWQGWFAVLGLVGIVQVWWLYRTSQESKERAAMWAKHDRLAGEVAAFKLHVASDYATQAALREAERLSREAMRDLERRLTEHLVRIEVKLDVRAPTHRAE